MSHKGDDSIISKQERAVKQQEILEKKRRAKAEYNMASRRPKRSRQRRPKEQAEGKDEKNRKLFASRLGRKQHEDSRDGQNDGDGGNRQGHDNGRDGQDHDHGKDRHNDGDSRDGQSRGDGRGGQNRRNGRHKRKGRDVEAADRQKGGEEDVRVTASQWFLSICWLKIPVAGFVYAVILACSPRAPREKRNFARGYLLYRILVLALSLTVLYVAYQVGLGFVDELLSYVRD